MHGDASIKDTICAMGQWWNTPIRLVEKQGNYGTVQGDAAAAGRYIEAGMCQFSWDNFFKEWSPNITEFVPNYTGDQLEPEFLPSAMPIILCKNIMGLGYGASTGIPYFCPNELLDATIKLIKNPRFKPVLIPDSPTGCPIVDNDWQTMCDTGYGSFIYRGETTIDDNGNIVILSIPNSTSTLDIIAAIKKKVEAKQLDGIDDMIDETHEDEDSADIKLIIEVKKGFSPEIILDKIYKMTELQTSFTVKLDVVYDYENFHVSLKAMMLNWIDFRRETKRRFISAEYSTVRRRIHLLEAIIKILTTKNGDNKLLEIGKKSKNRKEMVDKLIDIFDISDIQAEALADMKFYNLSKDNMSDYKSELKKLKAEEKIVKKGLEDDDLVDEMIIEELKEIKSKYGIARRSKIIPAASINQIPDSKHIVAITNMGYVKKLDASAKSVGTLNEGDSVDYTLKIGNRETIFILNSDGLIFKLPVYQIANTGKKQEKLSKILGDTGKIVSVLTKPSDKEIESSEKMISLFTVSKNGYVKKSVIGNYGGVTTKGIVGVSLSEGDELADAKIIKGDKDIILYTEKGNYIKFNTSEVSDTGRATRGVIGVKLGKTDKVVGLDILQKTKNYVVVVTNKGNGKKCLLRSFDQTKRGAGGSTLVKLKSKESIIKVESARNGSNVDIATSEMIHSVPVSDIPELLKMAECKQLVKLGKKEDIHMVSISNK